MPDAKRWISHAILSSFQTKYQFIWLIHSLLLLNVIHETPYHELCYHSDQSCGARDALVAYFCHFFAELTFQESLFALHHQMM